MSNETMNQSFEKFRENTVSLLELSFLTLVFMDIIGFGFYISILPNNVQNTLPLLLVLFLAVFTWVFRVKVNQGTYDDIRAFLIQWLVITTIVIVFSVFVILIYPFS